MSEVKRDSQTIGEGVLPSYQPQEGRQVKEQFKRDKPRLRCIGVLSPIAGSAAAKIRIDGQVLIIGRDPKADAVIRDPSVSRRHARITHDGKEFMLEDLGSSNGTHVDGAPIVYCLLHDGDTVQIGQNLFYFERALEPDLRPTGAGR